VLRNLVGNAARYGGTRIDVRVEGSRAVVADDGEGVPPSHREAIFEPFHTAHADMRPAGSVGLGLWVSRQLAERMGGSLEYRYEEGESRFVLTLPPG
jgi:signal transduction histidine kinase